MKLSKKAFIKRLDELFNKASRQIIMTSSNTGKEYTVEVIPQLDVTAISKPTEQDGKFIYSIIDVDNDWEFSIKAPNQVPAQFGSRLRFENVRGGFHDTGVWFAADSVSMVDKHG